jgi:hypothetical protein
MIGHGSKLKLTHYSAANIEALDLPELEWLPRRQGAIV